MVKYLTKRLISTVPEINLPVNALSGAGRRRE